MRLTLDLVEAVSGTATKAVWVLALFAFAARQLDIVQFADFSFWLTVSVVVSLFFDFGQQTALLTRSSSRYRVAFAYSQRKLGFSLTVFFGLLVTALIIYVAGIVPNQTFVYLMICLFSAAAGSLTITYCIPHRARRNFRIDLRTGVVECITVIVGCFLVAYFSIDQGTAVLGIYGSARAAGALTAVSSSRLGLASLLKPRLPDRRLLRYWFPFFLHMLFGTLILNVDLLVGRFSLSVSDYAIYQGGMRLVQAGNLIITVISNVFIPTWSQSDAEFGYPATNAAFMKTTIIVSVLSIIGIGILSIYGTLLAALIFGADFSRLGQFLPLFGVLILIRLAGAFSGVLLTCRNRQKYRTMSSMLGVVILTMLIIPWAGGYSMQYMVQSQLVAHSLMMIFLAYSLRKIWMQNLDD